jgi:hypothetical protein
MTVREAEMARWHGLMVAGMLACGDGEDGKDTAPDGETDTPVDSDPAVDTDVAPETDSPVETDTGPTPLIGEVLDCGRATSVGGLSDGTSATALQQVVLDTTVFPDALCNDGTPAVIYVRPAETPAGANRWVLQLMGGGGCNTPQECANRWCNTDTNFSMTQMTTSTAPPDTNGVGIFARASDRPISGDNPFADANQVLLKYCSSDTWRGTARDVVVDAEHPRTAAPVTFRTHFLGRRILEATLATLRQDGTPPVVYTATGEALSDLDEATEVVLAGASAGGGGTTYSLDWLAETLRVHTPQVEVYGLIDSTFSPDPELFDYASSLLCSNMGLCTPEQYLTYADDIQRELWQVDPEASCAAYHTADAWRCASDTHVIMHHLQTPFFVRQGLIDSLISGPIVDTDLRYNGADADMQVFADLVRDQILALPNLLTTAEEAGTMSSRAGGYGPRCEKHETLRSTEDTFDVTIQPSPGDFRRMFDLWTAWRAGSADSALASQTSNDTTCF